MPEENNITPINDEARRVLEQRETSVAAETSLEPFQEIEALEKEGKSILSRLVVYWSSQDPSISDKASQAISNIVEVTLMKPPTRP